MKHTIKTTFGAALVLTGALTSAQAALLTRLGGQAVYDTELNVTWLANANLAATNTFGVTISGVIGAGSMNWSSAQAWIAAMNSANYLGYHDWRLPTTLQPDTSCSAQPSDGVFVGYNCTGSELGHLFYNELGGVSGSSILTTHNANLSLFQNVKTNGYWSGTELNTLSAWDFRMYNGYQGPNTKSSVYFAWAVRTSDVAADTSAVPVPAAAWLFGSGLLGLVGVARRKAA